MLPGLLWLPLHSYPSFLAGPPLPQQARSLRSLPLYLVTEGALTWWLFKDLLLPSFPGFGVGLGAILEKELCRGAGDQPRPSMPRSRCCLFCWTWCGKVEATGAGAWTREQGRALLWILLRNGAAEWPQQPSSRPPQCWPHGGLGSWE
jgi:hypothetical protein